MSDESNTSNVHLTGSGNLLKAIQIICYQTKTEGRIIQLANGKVLVFDCPYWSNRASILLHLYNSSAITSIEQNTSSLSGFVVVIEEKKTSNIAYRIFLSIFSTFWVYGCLWIIHNYAINNDDHNYDLSWRTMWKRIMNTYNFSYNVLNSQSSNGSCFLQDTVFI